MLKRYMHKRERYFAMLNDNRVVRPFEWGTEFIGHESDAADPHKLFSEYSAKTIANSDEYFAIPSTVDFHVEGWRQESVPSASAGRSPDSNEVSSPPSRDPPADADGTDSCRHLST